MTIQELYDFLGEFIKKHPQCKNQEIMVKNMQNADTWEAVTAVTNTVSDTCPEYGSPLYFHSPSQEQVVAQHQKKLKKLQAMDDYIVER